MDNTITQHGIWKMVQGIGQSDPRIRTVHYWDALTVDPKAVELPALVFKYGQVRSEGSVIYATFYLIAFDRVLPDRSNVALIPSQLTTILIDHHNQITRNIEAWEHGVIAYGQPTIDTAPEDEEGTVKAQALTFTLQLPDTACLTSLGFGQIDLSGDGYSGTPSVPSGSFDCADLLSCDAFNQLIADLSSVSAQTTSNTSSIAALSAVTTQHTTDIATLFTFTGGTPFDCGSLSGCSTIQDLQLGASSLSSSLQSLSGWVGSISAVTSQQGASIAALSGSTVRGVLPGLNVWTGGTASRPTVNLNGSINLTGVTAIAATVSSALTLTNTNVSIGQATIIGDPTKPTTFANGVFNWTDSTVNFGRNMVFEVASDATRFRSAILGEFTAGLKVTGVVSGTTFYSGATELGSLFVPTYVQEGANIITGGTPSRPSVRVVSSPSFTTVSATTFVQNGTALSSLFAPISVVPTYVQNGTNTTTGGTITRPTVNVSSTPSFTSVSASTITASTLTLGTIVQSNTQSVLLSSPFVTSSATYVDVTGLGLPVEANTSYSFQFIIAGSSSGTTTGAAYALNGPASPTVITYMMQGTQAAGALFQHATGYDFGAAAGSVAVANANYTYLITGTLVNGPNAGTLNVRAIRGGIANYITAKAGSSGLLTKLG